MPQQMSAETLLTTTGGNTGISLVLGTNTFGWTNTQADAFAVLDAFVGAGGVAIDTADSYSHHVPGNVGGESETMIGEWVRSRGRDRLVIATKVSAKPSHPGLSAHNVRSALDESLRRLQTDAVDLYYAHYDDPAVPIEETAAAFSELVDLGKVRAIGLSNYEPARIEEWMAVTHRDGLHSPVALQPMYNLVAREFEATRKPAAEAHGLAVFPYFALASGFLTGKYRDEGDGGSARDALAKRFLDARGRRVLQALDEVAAMHDVPVSAVAIAWLRGQPTVTAPIASARTIDQLDGLVKGAHLTLSDSELATLTAASA